MPSQDITYFARTDHRGVHRRFGIRTADRRSHMYVIGATGTGKSTLLKTLILSDLWRGAGLALFDPHGDLAEEIVSRMPAARPGYVPCQWITLVLFPSEVPGTWRSRPWIRRGARPRRGC
jgi:DNA helicase HerA-like ATPase